MISKGGMIMAILAQRTVDLTIAPGDVLPVVNVSQYDSAYQLNCRLWNTDDTPYLIPENANARLDMTKEDGNGVSVAMTISNANRAICYLWMVMQMTTCVGDNTCEIVLVHRDDGRRLGTINFIMRVERAALRNNAVVSESQISYVQQKIDQWASIAAYGDALDAAQTQVTQMGNNISNLHNDLTDLENATAPKDHASSSGEYGLATPTLYGHVKIWDSMTDLPTGDDEPCAAQAGNLVTLNNKFIPAIYTPRNGWTWGESFNAASSSCYCRRMHDVIQITFAAAVKSDISIPAAVSKNIIENLPVAMTRVYVQAAVVTFSSSTPSGITPVMCAIRPEESAADSNQILKIDGATNPTAIGPSQVIFGTITYITNDWA